MGTNWKIHFNWICYGKYCKYNWVSWKLSS